ncbi:hypothetical protein M501DRAFT_990558 [Patellaria atrata CBS 101060]|uniref:GOLD domain-containing protein n=1 Tax=Patellaria atrata CBS 101060 TaxID=1346257 RepID=A0A9P4VP85_9PEZI|nr:hypothetical protein M501DRAFT_990558 [Patellaria atrata CBS 101060]
MRSALFAAAVASLLLPAQALYFYMDATSPKCFFEELPKDTLVVGHYTATQWDQQAQAYLPAPDLGLFITVEEVFDNNHRIISQRGSSSGKFTFSAADSGEHRMCFLPTGTHVHTGWLTSGAATGGVKLSLDIAIGETSAIESADKGKMADLATKVKDLVGRVHDIKREQAYQREREAEFRDQSESTNARVVRWTLMQLAVLGVTCAWQLSHLRAFFIKQKLT